MKRIIMLGRDVILKELDKNRSTIFEYGIKQIGLFGSFARNEQTENSDIDFLIEFEQGEKCFDNYMNFKFFLENMFQRKVDLVIKENIKPALKNNILGSVIYAKGA
ncbi:MAG: nucleotidyltransferase family protein [Ruminiclostridium sp.]|nr:nucleotidyltransferase family protein [Ruminiclostridium sp.]